MSSKPEAQNEPTMEEILASIRRIISEDEPTTGKPAEAVPPATPPAAPKAAKPEPASPGADNILELTRMVADDGSIVDLTAQPAADEAPQAAEEAQAPEEPAEEPAPEAEDTAAQETPLSDELPGEELLRLDDAPEREGPAAEVARVPAAGGEGSEFVSAATAAAATASFAAVTKAAMANRQGNAVAIGGGRTLEELVRESLAPELKSWLDANLPDLVERIVREEIRKMIRRAEEH